MLYQKQKSNVSHALQWEFELFQGFTFIKALVVVEKYELVTFYTYS